MNAAPTQSPRAASNANTAPVTQTLAAGFGTSCISPPYACGPITAVTRYPIYTDMFLRTCSRAEPHQDRQAPRLRGPWKCTEPPPDRTTQPRRPIHSVTAKHQNIAFKPPLRCMQAKWSFLVPANHFLKITKNNGKQIFHLYGLCFLYTACKKNQQQTSSSCYSSSDLWRWLSLSLSTALHLLCILCRLLFIAPPCSHCCLAPSLTRCSSSHALTYCIFRSSLQTIISNHS